MEFFAHIVGNGAPRRITIYAPHGAAARAYAERTLRPGERIAHLCLASQATVDPKRALA